MRHALVHRVVLGLVALLVGASAAFAWRVGRPPAAAIAAEAAGTAGVSGAPSGGAALFERHCAGCHVAPDLATALHDAADPAAAATALRLFLAEHGDAGEREDRAIVEYLAAGASGR